MHAHAGRDGRTMYGGMTAWCEARGVKSIGHFMEHSNLYLKPEYCADDMMHPPYFYNDGHEDRWPLYRVWGDYR